MIVPVILSGGSGTRLWPLSRESQPKQFLALVEGESLLQQTLTRLDGLHEMAPPLLIGNQQHRFLLAEQLRQIGQAPSAIFLEPCGRNTAPAATVAALQATAQGHDPLLLLLPADHLIRDHAAFQRSVETACVAAEAGYLLTFGVAPTHPETGYGYIRAGADLAGATACQQVDRFVEKPDAETAAAYLAAGDYFWNSGMFLFRASAWLTQIERHAPKILSQCRQALEQAQCDLDFVRLDENSFSACPSDSIDYAVMEHTDQAAIVRLESDWSDIGAWPALSQVQPPSDAQDNLHHGDVLALDSRNCHVHAGDRRLVVTLGVEDLIVVDTPDALLVAARDQAQEVKRVVELLRQQGRPEATIHRKVYRPWGWYDGIEQGERFQVKRILVHPGAALSLQLHHHRAEHWIVVRGTARVTCGECVSLLSENQSTYIPLGTEHRLENPGKIDLELIEVQSGSYLGEDDIVRLEDRYGRTPESAPAKES